MHKLRSTTYFVFLQRGFSIFLALFVLAQSLAPIQVSAALFNDNGIDYSYLEPTDDPGFVGTLDPSIAGCPVGKECAVFTRGWTTGTILNPAEGTGVRSVCETSNQICIEQGYEGVVCDPVAWAKNEWDSPHDNYQRDYVNGQWITYGASGGNDEYWTKITCQRTPTPVVVDVCPNIDGAQPSVPSGMTTDGSDNCVAIDQKPTGYLDSASCTSFNGWTYDPDEPAVSNTVHFYADGPAGSGVFVGSITASDPRPDVNAAYNITGNHGFSFPTPDVLKDGATHTIYAYGINTNPDNPHANNQVLYQSWDVLVDHRTISGCTAGTSGTTTPVSSIQGVSIGLNTTSVSIPSGGSISVVVQSTATVSGPASLTQHGIERRINGGAWQNAGAWNDPIANQARTSDGSFTMLALSVAGTYEFRTYASIDNGTSYTYSSVVTVIATSGGGPVGGSTPTIGSFTASPTAIVSGSSVVLSWTSSNASSCTASGAWSGTKPTTGSETVGPFTVTATTTQTFTLSCANTNGTTQSSTSVTVTPAPSTAGQAPNISSFSVSPSSIASGASATLSWTSTGATSCTASGAWSGTKPTTGSETVGPFTVTALTTQTFTLSCVNSTGTSTSSVSLTVNPPGGTATGTISFSVPAGISTTEYGSTASFTVVLDSAPLATVTIPVSSSDTTEGTVGVTSLTFSPSNWNVPQSVIVTGVDDTVVDGDITYTILFGTTTSADINWNGIDPADVSIINIDNDTAGGSTGGPTGTTTIAAFSANPNAITSGNTSTLSWTSSNASSCTASGAWSGTKPTTGSETVGPFTVTSATTLTFVISCGNSTGTTTSTTTLSVTPPAPVTISAVSSGGGGGRSGGPCIGYGCPTAGGSVVPQDVWILIDTASSGGVATNPARVCKYDDFLTSFMKRGISNDPNEVRKLQYFLNTYEAATLPITGEFDLLTEQAVRSFQTKYLEEVLLPWGTTEPTGIVYITTTAAINRIFCGQNPEYREGDLKDILDDNVLYTPVDPREFEGVIGSNSTSTADFGPNIAGIIGALSQNVFKALGDMSWYPIIILILVLLGTGYAIRGLVIKDTLSKQGMTSFITAAALFGAGTALNALSTIAFLVDREWISSYLGMNVSTVLALNLLNLLAVVFICLFVLGVMIVKQSRRSVSLS